MTEQTDPCRGMRKALYAAATTALTALAVAIPGAAQSCQANQRLDVVGQRAAVAEQKAEATQEVVSKTSATAARTTRAVEKVAEQYVTRRELEDAFKQLGPKGKAVELTPQPIPVPPADPELSKEETL